MSRNFAAKYRPRKIDQVVGQEDAKVLLRQLVAAKHLPTTLLFAGPSGCGKTTMARIYASTINCATKNACGKCESCKLAMQDPPQHPDIREIDSSDARGIDDIRTMKEHARFAPQFRARVFILDEVHGLAPAAKNALLKIAEEPPENTVLCLCTTEPHMLQIAMLGRGKRIPVAHIGPQDMSAHLVRVAAKEGLNFKDLSEKGVSAEDTKANIKKLIRTLMDLSEGRMRDALFLLENVVMMHRDGKFPTLKALVEAYLKEFDLTADHAAIKALYCLYSGNLKGAVGTAYDMQDNPRALLHAARWMNDRMLVQVLGKNVRFPGYAFKKLTNLLSSKQMTPSLTSALVVQEQLNAAEWRMNSSSVPPHMLLCEHFFKACTAIKGEQK